MSDKIDAILKSLVEQLASIEHARWAHWQKYMHEKAHRNPDGSLLIPAKLVTKWEEQILKPYEELSDAEKDSDREQVEKYLPLIASAIKAV